MAVFLVDNDKTYTYEDLFCSLNHAIEYCPLLKTRDVYVYFVNLIRALTANRPLVLLDSDLNPSEIDGVDENEVNQTKVIEQKSFASMDDVVASLQQSSSEITIFTSGTTGQPKKVVHTVDTVCLQPYSHGRSTGVLSSIREPEYPHQRVQQAEG